MLQKVVYEVNLKWFACSLKSGLNYKSWTQLIDQF